MDQCGADLVCWMLSNLLDKVPYSLLPAIQIIFYVTLVGGSYWFGSVAGRGEGFINGIMYYLNIQVYNDANIPYKIDEDGEKHVKEAKRRLGRKIMPRVP